RLSAAPWVLTNRVAYSSCTTPHPLQSLPFFLLTRPAAPKISPLSLHTLPRSPSNVNAALQVAADHVARTGGRASDGGTARPAGGFDAITGVLKRRRAGGGRPDCVAQDVIIRCATVGGEDPALQDPADDLYPPP